MQILIWLNISTTQTTEETVIVLDIFSSTMFSRYKRIGRICALLTNNEVLYVDHEEKTMAIVEELSSFMSIATSSVFGTFCVSPTVRNTASSERCTLASGIM